MKQVKLLNSVLEIGSIKNVHIKMEHGYGLVTIRLAAIDYLNCGYHDVCSIKKVRIGVDTFKVMRRKLFLGAVNPEIPLEGDDVRSYICNYTENNVWIQLKFKTTGEDK